MTLDELYSRLTEAYSDQNLNRITLTLLRLYKEQMFDTLNKIASMMSDFTKVEIASDGKGFSKLMMLYHPDRGDFHRNAIAGFKQQGDFDALLEYSHILKLMRIEEVAAAIESFEDIDYSPVYEWDVQLEGFNIVRENRKKNIHSKKQSRQTTYSFYDALKIRYLGNLKTEIPFYALEELDEIELSESSIENLEGIGQCKYAKTVDLSGNQISDLSDLWGLSGIEELDLSDNQIGLIDPLANLSNLRSLNLSNNRVTELEPLFGLGKLEMVDLSGNPVKQEQVEELTELGIVVTWQ